MIRLSKKLFIWLPIVVFLFLVGMEGVSRIQPDRNPASFTNG